MADNARDAYVAGLTLLARRELSEAQVRQRLLRKGHSVEAVDSAIERLTGERALDDARTAEAIARTEVTIRGRGRLRVSQRIQSAGIASTTAKRAVEQVYADLDPDALLAGALDKRLRGRSTITDERERNRLYRYLIGQGFESDRVIAVLRKRSSGRGTEG